MKRYSAAELVDLMLHAVSFFRVTIAFAVAYMLVNWYYVVQLGQTSMAMITDSWTNEMLAFITSPVNILENQGATPQIWSQNITFNFTLLVFWIAIIELYSRLYRPMISVDEAFVLGLMATYMTSATVWLDYGAPAIGTSVVASVMLVYVVGISVWYMFVEVVRVAVFDLPLSRVLYICNGAVVAVSVIWAFAGLIIGNPSFPLHALGTTYFLVGASCVVSLKLISRRFHPKPLPA